MAEMIDRETDPTGFPHQMEKLREAKVLIFLKAKTSIRVRKSHEKRHGAMDETPMMGRPLLMGPTHATNDNRGRVA